MINDKSGKHNNGFTAFLLFWGEILQRKSYSPKDGLTV